MQKALLNVSLVYLIFVVGDAVKHFVVKYVFDCNCGNVWVVFVVCAFVIWVNPFFDIYLMIALVMCRV